MFRLDWIIPSHFDPHNRLRRRDALPRVRRCTSRRFFLLLLRTRSCAIGAEALSHQLNEVFAFLGRAMSDRAGARPYQLNLRRGSASWSASLPAVRHLGTLCRLLWPEYRQNRLGYPLTLARRANKTEGSPPTSYENPQVCSSFALSCRDCPQQLRARKSTTARRGSAPGLCRNGRTA